MFLAEVGLKSLGFRKEYVGSISTNIRGEAGHVSWACPGDMLQAGHVSWACPGCVLECVLDCVLAVSPCVLGCVLYVCPTLTPRKAP